MSAQTEPTTFTIPDVNFAAFEEKLAKLNRRAAKLGCDKITFTKVGTADVGHWSKSMFVAVGKPAEKVWIAIPATIITVTGTAPKLAGFQFIAKVETLSDGKSKLFHTVPGTNVKVDDRFRDMTTGTCEHCNKARTRREVFIVCEESTGNQFQIGRQCLADFTGITDPENIARRAEWLIDFESTGREFEGMGGRGFDNIQTIDVLTLTAAYIKLFGWTPKSAETGRPTSARVANHFLTNGSHLTDSERREMQDATDLIKNDPIYNETAVRVIEWIKTELSQTAKSDYEQNLVTLTVLGLTETKHIGLVASSVSAYQRAMNRKVEYAQRQTVGVNSKHVGAIGERMKNKTATVIFVKSTAGFYGPTTMIKLVDANDNLMTWFASSHVEVQTGNTVTFDGTVKAHKEYNGKAETQLTRVKLKVGA